MAYYKDVERRPIIYVDESGFELDAIRNNGYSIKGKRCYAQKDWHLKTRINAIGAIVDFKLFNVCLFNGYINSNVFYAWVRQELLPNLSKSSVIVMDNAAFHKKPDLKKLIKDAGHILEFLPPYSPDLNPIEKKWAQAKSIRKKFNYNPDELFLKTNL